MNIKKLIKQALGFIGISGIGWLIDFLTYTILGMFFKNYFVNNMISSCLGVTFVFLFSTRTIFKNNSKIPLGVKYIIYLVYQIILILIMSELLDIINEFLLSKIAWSTIQMFSHIIAKILITPITMILNFLVMKGLMEKL